MRAVNLVSQGRPLRCRCGECRTIVTADPTDPVTGPYPDGPHRGQYRWVTLCPRCRSQVITMVEAERLR